jgi:tetratricopeptide (TPR) repeat protein
LAAWQKFSSPPTQPHAAINLNALARLDLIEGRYSRAASRAREAADLFAPARADDPSALASKTTLTELDASLGRYDQAIGSLRESVHEAELGRRGLPPKHPYVAILKLRLAGIFLRAGRNTDAQASAGEAQKILADAGLNASRPAADALRIGGLAALRQGNRELSERQFDRAQKLLRPADDNHPVPASPELAALLAAQGELAGDLQNYTEAADDYRQAIEQLSQMFESRAANHPLRAEYLQALAKLLVREERPTEAKPLLEESLTIDRRALPPAHAATISVMADLAAVLEKTGSKSQAEELRKQAKQLRAQRSVTP